MDAKDGSAIAWLLAPLVVVAVACAIFFPYHSQHNTVNKLHGQVAALQAQLAKAQSAQAPAPSQSPAPAQPSTTYTSTKGVKVAVYAPAKDTAVSSPVGVIGEVPGSWSFEAQFPVVLADSTGKEVAKGTAQLLGDWMTTSLVPFSVKLTYTATPRGTGELVLQRDNPSGIATNEDSVSIPIKFE